MIANVFELFGRIFSRERIRALGRQIRAAGIQASPEAFAGYLVLTVAASSVFLAAVLFFLPATQGYFIYTLGSLLSGLGIALSQVKLIVPFVIIIFSLAMVLLATYFIVSAFLILRIDARKGVVENVLPDFLTLVGANVRAGMTLDQALWYAARPEFGILSVEVKMVVKGVFSGEQFNTAIDRLAEGFDSRILGRTVSLIKQASATGGEVAKIFEITAADARETAMLRKEIAATLLMYEIFVLFAACAGAPFLFAVMSRLIGGIQSSFGYAPQGMSTLKGAFSFGAPSAPLITVADFQIFSIGVILLNVLISAFIIGIIRTGSRKEGIKYFPVMLIVAYVIYYLVLVSLDSFLSGIIMR